MVEGLAVWHDHSSQGNGLSNSRKVNNGNVWSSERIESPFFQTPFSKWLPLISVWGRTSALLHEIVH